MNPVAARFGENMARAREQSGITQEELAFRASLHRTEIGLLERGGRVPRIDTLVKLKFSLGVSAEDLLAGMVWTPGDFRREGPWPTRSALTSAIFEWIEVFYYR